MQHLRSSIGCPSLLGPWSQATAALVSMPGLSPAMASGSLQSHCTLPQGAGTYID